MVFERHVGEQVVQVLDAPVPQMGYQLVDVLKIIDLTLHVLSEQVIEVPKINLLDRIPQRSALRWPQLAEQLVEVPTVKSQFFFQQYFVEQNVDIPVPGVRGSLDGGGPHGLPSGQGSRALRGAESRVGGTLVLVGPRFLARLRLLLVRLLMVWLRLLVRLVRTGFNSFSSS